MYIASIHSPGHPVDISFDQTKEGAITKARQKLSERMGLDLNKVEGFFLFEDEALSVELMETILSTYEIEQRAARVDESANLESIMDLFEAHLCCQA